MLSPDEILKVAKFQDVRTERNKRLLLCLLPSADDVQTSPGAGSRCKGTIIFGEMQENGEKNRHFQFRGGRSRMIFGAINKERRGLLGLAEGGDDESV